MPAAIKIREDWYLTYACQICKIVSEAPVIPTPKEGPINAGSFASPETVAHLMTQKFVMGSPIYRQEQELIKRYYILMQKLSLSKNHAAVVAF